MRGGDSAFGAGRPLPRVVSKLPPPEPPPADSPRRAYQVCEDGTLTVRYHPDWRVRSADYVPPLNTVKGRPAGRTTPLGVRIGDARRRLEQLRRIEAALRAR